MYFVIVIVFNCLDCVFVIRIIVLKKVCVLNHVFQTKLTDILCSLLFYDSKLNVLLLDDVLMILCIQTMYKSTQTHTIIIGITSLIIMNCQSFCNVLIPLKFSVKS